MEAKRALQVLLTSCLAQMSSVNWKLTPGTTYGRTMVSGMPQQHQKTMS